MLWNPILELDITTISRVAFKNRYWIFDSSCFDYLRCIRAKDMHLFLWPNVIYTASNVL